MTDHEESFLKDFFTHVANLGFDKAKELVVSNFSACNYEASKKMCATVWDRLLASERVFHRILPSTT
jgi:hypothetical protein